MRALRNILAHEYDRVDLEIIWQVINEELPSIIPKLHQVYKEGIE